ncbi:MAG: hypothetical protein JJU06_05885 [Ectothiorhodospiraceae bacterium]|nr:hypothetical protein [Ectothiorhodospiraceae bacterium]MCH8502894.1 hypothetical protein [Ectothiorhodospiraceae bacterium]
MTEQQALWHDTLEDALRDLVVALGGPKRVGSMIWPDKDLSAAARLLNHCLDPERPEKLELSQVVFLLVTGRERECHTAMHYLTAAAGYETPRPINVETENQKLQRQYIEATQQMAQLVKKMERINGGNL